MYHAQPTILFQYVRKQNPRKILDWTLFEMERNVFSILVIQFEKCIFWKVARIKWKWHFEICIWNVICVRNCPTHSHRARGKNKTSQFRFTSFAARLIIPPFLAHFSILGDAATYTRHLSLFHSRSRSECAWREEERWDRHQRYGMTQGFYLNA